MSDEIPKVERLRERLAADRAERLLADKDAEIERLTHERDRAVETRENANAVSVRVELENTRLRRELAEARASWLEQLQSDEAVVIYECPVCHYKDDRVIGEAFQPDGPGPLCPAGEDRMVPVRYYLVPAAAAKTVSDRSPTTNCECGKPMPQGAIACGSCAEGY
jgi:hypothetical protein